MSHVSTANSGTSLPRLPLPGGRPASLFGILLVASAGWLAGCGAPPVEPPAPDTGPRPAAARIPNCSPGAAGNYLVRDAQQCWFTTPAGRWRTVSHELHYDTLVVRAVADPLDVAAEVAARFVDVHGERFAEILIYLEEEAAADGPSRIRRVRWTRTTGFDQLDFPGA